jgi:hypothetical protein
MIDLLTDQQYAGLVAVIDGKTPTNAAELEREGLLEPLTQPNIEDRFVYRLTSEGRRHYTQFCERRGTDHAHLQ